MGFQELLKKVASGARTAKNLSAEEAEDAMESMLRGVREELGFRTAINTAELLLNPASARSVLIGVTHPPFVERLCKAAAMLGAERVLVFQGVEGSDELPVRSVKALECRDDELKELLIDPQSMGLAAAKDTRLLSAVECAALTRKVLAGEERDCLPGVLLNAGARVYACGKAASVAEGVEKAREAIRSGKAAAKLEAAARVSAGLGASSR